MSNNRTGRGTTTSVSAAALSRMAGLFAILAGILFIVIQLIHPPETLASVHTAAWTAVASLTMAMSVFFLIGMAGIYMKQAEKAGWLGLIGSIVFGLFWLASTAFGFVEAFVLPVLVSEAPEFVEGFLGIFGGGGSEAELGVLPALAPMAGALYLLGGLLLGIATFRAGVLPRSAGVLLAGGAVVTLAAAVIPHPLDRILAVPMGLAFIWLGCVLWAKRA